MINNDILHIERDKLIQSIFEIKDVDVIKKVRTFIKKAIPRPAVMTVDKLKGEVLESVKQAENGQVIAHDALFAKYEL